VDQDRLTLHLTNQLAEIPRSAMLVEAYCEQRGVAPAIVFSINVSLEELLANTITYGYDDDRPRAILVEIWHAEGQLWVEVTDDARPFDPTQVPSPDLDAPLEQRSVGGLGIHLVREMMDDLAYWHADGSNHVQFRKRLAGPDEAD
jgi:serine/threonine-protein kinase RsbW